jgi:hypothetical protein
VNNMKHWIRGGAVLFLATVASPTPTIAPQGIHACGRSNRALLLCAQNQAQADFWQHVAECLGGPAGGEASRLKDAYIQLRDADALALQIFNARETACAMFGHLAYDPQIDPAQFGSAITNPYAPVKSGRTLVREKHTSRGVERIEMSMNNEIREVAGVPCRTLREREMQDGVLVEDTQSWIAQHQSGAVWNFGELAMGYDDGVLDRLDGSWRYGSEGAKPGILAPHLPSLGDVYRQELALGHAEGISRIVRFDETVSVPAGVFDHCLVIEDWDPLEPLEFILSFIAPDVGLVLEVDERTGERSELVEIHN